MGAVIKYAEYIMGVVFILQMTAFIPSIGSQRENAKRAKHLKISQRFLQYPLTYPKEKIVGITQLKFVVLQFVYKIQLRIKLSRSHTPLSW